MRIASLHIVRFGVWRDLRIDFPESGVNVICGPNEAGKSTILRFIREMLFGFAPGATGERDFEQDQTLPAGRLTLRRADGDWQIQRAADASGENSVLLVGPGGRQGGEAEWRSLLGEVSEALFRNVYAVGLREIQELATLHEADVAQHIYGLTLGHRARALLGALEQSKAARTALWDPATKSGEMAELQKRRVALDRELAEHEAQRRLYVALTREVARLESVTREHTSRKDGLQSQLRGHQFLERVFEPWRRVEALREELRQLDYVDTFPEDGLARVDRYEKALAEATSRRESLLASADDYEAQAEVLEIDPELRRQMAVMRGLVDQRDWIEARWNQQRELAQKAEAARAEVDAALETLGPDWDLKRLEAADTSTGRHLQLIAAAREYVAALKYRRKRRKRYDRLAAAETQREALFADAQKALDAADIPQAIARAQSDVARLQDLAEFRVERRTLERKGEALDEQIARLKDRLGLPRWMVLAIWMFVICGASLAGLGFYTGLTVNLVAGLVYVFTGGFTGTLLWAVTWSYQRSLRERMESLRERRVENASQLKQVLRNIELVERELPEYLRELRVEEIAESEQSGNAADALTATEAADGEEPAGPEQLRTRAAMQRMAELERLAQTEANIRKQRRRLSQMRSRFRDVQRRVTAARQAWCQLLQQAGFAETIRVEEAFGIWQQVVEAAGLARDWRALGAEARAAERAFAPYRDELDEACRELDGARSGDAPDELLQAWEARVEELEADAREQSRLRREAERCRRESADLLGPLHENRTGLEALLVRTGAADIEEFRLFARESTRRQEVLAELRQAEFELQTAASTEPELAMSEEDLRAFDADRNVECIETLELELQDLESDIRTAYERLGRCKQEMSGLEADERPLEALAEKEHVDELLEDAGIRWHGVQLASRALHSMRDEYEHSSQPAVLQAASAHLARMSEGRYRRVWAPLGERRLLVDDEQGATWPVERLSRGAREQLYLAVRLAAVDALAERGVALPLVLDDVLVNLDQARTEAAVRELAEVATGRRQVLFLTCHQHVAGMFEAQGSQTLHLPAHREAARERRAG